MCWRRSITFASTRSATLVANSSIVWATLDSGRGWIVHGKRARGSPMEISYVRCFSFATAPSILTTYPMQARALPIQRACIFSGEVVVGRWLWWWISAGRRAFLVGSTGKLCMFPFTEHHGAEADICCAQHNGVFKIGAHAHAEIAQVVAMRQLFQQRKMRCGRLVYRRDAHQAADSE